jgi:WD40 repeat protein
MSVAIDATPIPIAAIANAVKAIPAATLSEVTCLKSESPVNSFGFSMFNDNLVAGAHQDGSITFYDLQSKKLLHKITEN